MLFHTSNDPKYELLENPRKKCNFVAHSWAIFGLFVLTFCIAVISLIMIWDEIKQMQHKTEALDFVLFGPKREVSDIVRFSEYRALTYALANDSSIHVNMNGYDSYDLPKTFQHEEKKYSLVCYYVVPSRSSPQDRLSPSKIDPTLCTHIIISFATLDYNIIHFIESEAVETIVKLKSKNPRLKFLLSVVSFSTSEDAFAVMISNQENRQQFIDSALELMQKYSLDGIDLDWEFPAWPISKNATQKDQFVTLLEEMRITFAEKYLLSVAVAAPVTIIDRAYDVPKLAKYVDFVNIMCYDYHSFVWYFPMVGSNAPLYPSAVDEGYFLTLNANYTVRYWMKKGMPANKIMMGIPIYGHSWSLSDPQYHDIGAAAKGFGNIGEKGFISYRDVCKFLESGSAHAVFDGNTRTPYTYKQSEWFSFENERSLAYKAEYVTKLGLGGAMVFSLNQDDADGKICNSKISFPLVNRIKTVFED